MASTWSPSLARPRESRGAARRVLPQGATRPTISKGLLRDPGIEVVDITTHPDVRVGLMRRALNAGKHVLSQKPFVEDLAVGQALVALAEAKGVKLAVNQNGRWAPHLA